MDPHLLLFVAAFIVGTAKGGIASVGSIAVPMVAIVMNPVEAAATLLPVYIVTDWVGVWLYRRNFSRRNLSILIPSTLFGIAVATAIVTVAPEALLLIFTALIGFWYSLRSWLRRGPLPRSEARVGPGLGWGTLAGITSYITHSAGPPTQAYILPQQLPKLEYAGTLAILFAIVNIAKLPGYAMAGLFDGLDWPLIARLVVAGVAGTLVGRWLTGVLPQAVYVRVIEGLLFALSIVLVSKGVAMLLG